MYLLQQHLSVYQIVPSIGSGDSVRPDWRYALTIKEETVTESNGEVEFSTNQKVRFNYSSSFDPTEVSVYQIDDNNNEPIKYLLKKYVKATSGKEKTQTFTFWYPKDI